MILAGRGVKSETSLAHGAIARTLSRPIACRQLGLADNLHASQPRECRRDLLAVPQRDLDFDSRRLHGGIGSNDTDHVHVGPLTVTSPSPQQHRSPVISLSDDSIPL
jgi:hypothetical protein